MMWYSMACGPPIDEQRSLRQSTTSAQTDNCEDPIPSSAQARSEAQSADSDEEVDPNDIVQPTHSSDASYPQGGLSTAVDPTGWDDYSDEDY